MLREVIQSQDRCCLVSRYQILREVKIRETESRVVGRGAGGGEGRDVYGDRASVLQDEELQRWMVGMVANTVSVLHTRELYT